MRNKADRYQHQPWYVKLWRRRHYVPIPLAALRMWLSRPHCEDGEVLSFKVCWSIAIGLAQVKMNWLHDWSEIRDRMRRKTMAVTAEDVRREIEADLETLNRHAAERNCPDWLLPLFQAGDWIGNRVEMAGGSEKEAKDLSFALGQIVRMRGVEKSFEVAAECFNRWLEGNPDKPGEKLAEALIAGKR